MLLSTGGGSLPGSTWQVLMLTVLCADCVLTACLSALRKSAAADCALCSSYVGPSLLCLLQVRCLQKATDGYMDRVNMYSSFYMVGWERKGRQAREVTRCRFLVC